MLPLNISGKYLNKKDFLFFFSTWSGRLLTEDVFAIPEYLDLPLIMHGILERDIYCLYLRIIEQILIVPVCPFKSIPHFLPILSLRIALCEIIN